MPCRMMMWREDFNIKNTPEILEALLEHLELTVFEEKWEDEIRSVYTFERKGRIIAD